ncbi:hypothetical protein A4X06_0g2414 [Tilletia controversa]|uniref:Bromo domain-containing protein n=1 Tax=Tilletia controversa TaxID=13291 RepID=A0A8X7SYX0_9BASI|nr:hypothetical protein CF328_g3533 [Tilletia controversa]KAE8252132.1 hypothetical protein A4X06_0g2414 [Tilletia controversa]
MDSVLPDNDHNDHATHEVPRNSAQSVAHPAHSHSFNAVNQAADAGNEDDDDDDGDYEEGDLQDGDADASADLAFGNGRPYADGDVPMLSHTGMSIRRGRGKYLKPKPLDQVLTRVITALIRRDTYGFFTDPVNPDEVPGYTDVVKQPLDFGTIRERVEAQEYTNVSSFTDDVYLVFRNAKTFNAPHTIFHSEADRIQAWFTKKMTIEGPSAILPDPATLKAREKARGRASTISVSAGVQVKEEDDDEDEDNDYDSANEDLTRRGSASAAGGSQRGGRTASPETSRQPHKKRKLNTGGDDPATSTLAALLSSSGGFVGIPGPNTSFAKAIAAASVTQARWRYSSSAASLCAHRIARIPLLQNSESNLLSQTLGSAAISDATVTGAQDLSGKGPISVPQVSAGDESIPSVNPLHGLRKVQFHPDGSIKIPGFVTPAQGWPDTSEAFAMNLLPTSKTLYTQLGLQLLPPRIRALFAMLPLPAPPDAVTTANGKALPVPLTVGGTSALNAAANLASASFSAAQQTPWTSSGNPFPNHRNEATVLQSASIAAVLLPHPVPIGTTYSHEVSMQTNGGQSAFGPGQGADGGPWTVSSGGPDKDPETTVLAATAESIEASSEPDPETSWLDKQVRKASAVPPRWALPGVIPYSSGSGGYQTHANGTATPGSPSTPVRIQPVTPMGVGPSFSRGSPSPAPGLTQPSTPIGSAPSNLQTSAAHGWAQRASKGRERERERESDLRDWTITRPILERAMTFEDVGAVWAEVRTRMASTVRSMYHQTIEDTRSKVLSLSRELMEAQKIAGRRGDAQQILAQIQAQRSFIEETTRLLSQTGRAEDDVGTGRDLGRYDFVEGEQLLKMLEYALETEPAQKLWEASAAIDSKVTESTVGAEGGLGYNSKQEIQEDVTVIQQGVWGGPLGEAYASSVARFINGAKQSADDWADFSTGVEEIEDDDEDAEATAAVNGAGDPVGEEDQLHSARKRNYRDEDYIGGGLRVLLVPPADETVEEAATDDDDRGDEASRNNHGPTTTERHATTTDSVSANPLEGVDSALALAQKNNDSSSQPEGRRRRWPVIERDGRALEDTVRDDVLDPLTGGMLSVLHLAGEALSLVATAEEAAVVVV